MSSDEAIQLLKQCAHEESSLSLESINTTDQSITLSNQKFSYKLSCSLSVKNENDESSILVYSLLSIFLQIYDKNISLMNYRRICSEYNVEDPVKTLHKSLILAYFYDTADIDAVAAAPQLDSKDGHDIMMRDEQEPFDDQMIPNNHELNSAKSTEILTATGAATSATDHSSHKSRDKHKSREHRSSSSSKKHTSTTPSASTGAAEKKKEKVPMTQEQILQNLKIVVDKRTTSTNSTTEKEDDLVAVDPTIITDITPTAVTLSDSKNDEVPPLITQNDNAIPPTKPVGDSSTTKHPSELVEDEDEYEKSHKLQLIKECLSAKGYEAKSIPNYVIEKDRLIVEKITSMEIPVGNSASILRCGAGPSLMNGVGANTFSTPGKHVSTSHGISSTTTIAASRDFTRVLELYNETLLQERKSDKRSNTSTSATTSATPHKRSKYSSISSPAPTAMTPSSSSANTPSTTPLKKITGKPIIIVPSAMTSPITLINALEFFQNAKFISRDIMLKSIMEQGKKKPSVLTISRNVSSRLGGGKVEYEIMDNPTLKLQSKEDWDRIVAVIPQGAAWQFKGWKLGLFGNDGMGSTNSSMPSSLGGGVTSQQQQKQRQQLRESSPVDVFSHSFGFYIGFEGAPLPQELVGWSVKKATLSRDKRGLDSVVYASFWNGLDEWMSIHKRHYLPRDSLE